VECPFCCQELKVWNKLPYASAGCENPSCLVDDMPRYQITYAEDGEPTNEAFMLGQYYVQIGHLNQITVISRLEACFLMDSVQVNKVLDFDLFNPSASLSKLNLLMAFS
jgi:hypothetical protein